MTTWTITEKGWLVCGSYRVRLAAVESTELRGARVILRHVGSELVIDCSATVEGSLVPSDEKASELMAALDAHFAA